MAEARQRNARLLAPGSPTAVAGQNDQVPIGCRVSIVVGPQRVIPLRLQVKGGCRKGVA